MIREYNREAKLPERTTYKVIRIGENNMIYKVLDINKYATVEELEDILNHYSTFGWEFLSISKYGIILANDSVEELLFHMEATANVSK